MTSNEITAEVQKIVTDLRARLPKGGRKQYPAAKHQIATLTNLGLIDAMPRGFGYQDAAEVITQATSGRRNEGALNAEGEGDEWAVEASTLYTLLNPNSVEAASHDEYTGRDELDDLIDAVYAAEEKAEREQLAAAMDYSDNTGYTDDPSLW